MGYRQIEKHKPKPNRTAQKTATPVRYFMQNGTTFNLAIPCWYKEIHKPIKAHHHCRAKHDHYGWPNPDHPDHSCQWHDFAIECHNPFRHHGECHHHHHYIDMADLFPIHLTKEGYSKIIIAFDKELEGLEAEGYIDEKDDWVIRVDFSAYLLEAIDKHVDVRFVVKVADEDETMVDVASFGLLRILPLPLEGNDE